MGLLEMDFQASLIISVIIICRFLFINKLPKKVFLILWYVALIRLLVPYSFPSISSIYSLAEQNNFIMEKTEIIMDYGRNRQGQKAEKPTGTEGRIIKTQAENNTAKNSFSIWKFIWIAGGTVYAAMFITAYILCYKRFCISLPVNNPEAEEWIKSHKSVRHISIRQSCMTGSPLSYGILRPVILMPETTDWKNTKNIQYILEHEFIHIKRFDAVLKLFLMIATGMHWFNPLVWAMYILVNRDIELSCDEAVIRRFGRRSKKDYAMLLINMEEEKNHTIPLGSNFSRNAAEERITAIMKIKDVSWVTYIMAALLVTGIVAGFATSAVSTGNKHDISNLFVNGTGKEKEDTEEEEAETIQEEWISDTYSNIIGEIAAKIAEKKDYEALSEIAAFVQQEDLDKIVIKIIDKGDYEAVMDIVPFISEDLKYEIEKSYQ